MRGKVTEITRKAAFIGRFQPLHVGHRDAIERMKDRFELVIAVGSPRKSRTGRNPLSFEERKVILDEAFPELEKIAVEDEDRGEAGHSDWGRRLVESTGAEKIISRNEMVIDIVERHTDAEIVEHDLQSPERYSGTRIRNSIREGEEWKHLVPGSTRTKTDEYQHIIERTQDGSR